MERIPAWVWLLMSAGLLWLGVHGLRGLMSIREALLTLDIERLAPARWAATRALVGVLAAMPVVFLTRELGAMSLVLGLVTAASGFAIMPHYLAGVRQRLERKLLDDLALHLDLIAVAVEAGSSWSAALSLCVERTPESPLRRLWQQVILDIHGGMEPLDALRVQEQRLRLQPLTTLLSALRAADKLGLPAAVVLRDRARHCAAARFARAERQARAAPLKLWAAMLLCLVPCTAAVLAYPLAGFLARLIG